MAEGEKKVNRRSAIKAVGAGVAGLIVGGVIGSQAFPKEVVKEVTKTTTARETITKTIEKKVKPWIPEKWDEEHDVIVVGSGFAALAAAIEAKLAGADVLVIEKMPSPGGNSAINGGAVAAPGSDLQKKEGIEDSPELLYKDMLKAGLYINHPELARTVAENAWPAVKWTIEFLGVEYSPHLAWFGGHSVKRSYTTKIGSGWGIVSKELEKLEELGVEVRTNCKMTRIIREGIAEGRVLGVEVREGYEFPDETTGTIKYIKARKAVVLGTGGFSQDVRLRMIQDPRLTEKVMSTNQPGATGEALLEALNIGASPVQLSWIQLGPWASPDEPGFGVAPFFALFTKSYGIQVDPETGRRFMNELGTRKECADAILALGHPAIAICDSDAYEKLPSMYREKIEKEGISKGVIRKFDTIEELAKAYNINLEGLKAEIERYNSLVEKGVDEDFGRPSAAMIEKIDTPPFYACRLWPKVHHCMGGVQINTKAQVIDKWGNVIPGLYAAGEVTGGVHGACRLGSVAVADCLVFGRIAGQNAAKEPAWT